MTRLPAQPTPCCPTGSRPLPLWKRSGLILALASLSACSVTPRHTVLPYPEHVRAGIEAGNKVEIVTRDGRDISMIVTDVTSTAIVGHGQSVLFDDIATLEKHAWKPARNPCDDGAPLGCSIPKAITLLSEFHEEYRDYFDGSCTQHDFCYRFGFQTYGFERTDCDTDFLENMRRRCSSTLKLDPLKRAECQVAAKHLYNNVVRYGEPSFRAETGRYCEYAGPPSVVKAR